MRVGILGSGEVARALARGFVSSGHTVRFGTRSPENSPLVGFARGLGGAVSVGSFADAASFGEVVVLAVLGSAAETVIRLSGPERLAGKVLIDTTNPLVFSPDAPPRLFVGQDDSLGERVQRAAPAARVVKAFNTVGNTLFYRPTLPGGPPDMFICGEEESAKRTVAGVLEQFGWRVLDLGGIEVSRILEPACLLWVRSARVLGDWEVAFKLLAGSSPRSRRTRELPHRTRRAPASRPRRARR